MTGPCHVERVAGVPVLVNGELTAEDRRTVADFAALLGEIGRAQAARDGERLNDLQRAELARRARRLGEPCDQCTGHDREHADDCPEAAL